MLLVLACVIALVGYREARQFEERYGHPPFGLPPAGWAAVCFVSLLIGAFLLWAARRGEKQKPVEVKTAKPLQTWARD